jgi:hypothetical protein
MSKLCGFSWVAAILLILGGVSPSIVSPSIVSAEPLCKAKLKIIKGTNHQNLELPPLRWKDLPADIRGQLKPLPFNYYEILIQAEKLSGLRLPAEFEINAEGIEPGQLVVHQVARQGDASDLMVDWSNSNGEKLLSSKVRLADGDTWVMGTDGEKGNGSILCLKFDCPQAP